MRPLVPILATAVMASSVVAGAYALHDPDAPATGVEARVEAYRTLGAQVASALDRVDGLVGDAAWGVMNTPGGVARVFTVAGVTREECRAIEASFDRDGIPDDAAGEEGCTESATGFLYYRKVAPYSPPVAAPTTLATGPAG